MESLPLSVLIKHGIMALFAAMVQALIEHREGRSKTFMDWCMLTIIGFFSGIMFGLMALNFFPHNLYISLGLTGTGAILGKEGLKFVAQKLLEVLRVSIKPRE